MIPLDSGSSSRPTTTAAGSGCSAAFSCELGKPAGHQMVYWYWTVIPLGLIVGSSRSWVPEVSKFQASAQYSGGGASSKTHVLRHCRTRSWEWAGESSRDDAISDACTK